MKTESTESNNNLKNQQKGRELFYGVIAIAVFIVMAVGATFAYFTATTRSTNTAVTTRSSSLQLQYISYSSAWIKNDLIPVDTAIAEYSVEFQNDTTAKMDETNTKYLTNNTLCVDDYGNSVCSVYEFQVKNTANSPLTVDINLLSTINEFANLNAMVYQLSLPEADSEDEIAYKSTENNNGANDPKFLANDLDDAEDAIIVEDGQGQPIYSPNYDPIYINRKGVIKKLLSYTEVLDETAGTTSTKPSIDRQVIPVLDQFLTNEERTAKLADNININGGETLTFAIVLYIKNINGDQTEVDAEKKFNGQVIVTSGDGDTGISGIISTVNENDLQANQ